MESLVFFLLASFLSFFVPSSTKDFDYEIRKVYITVDGVYKAPTDSSFLSIYIPQNVFEGYRYLTIQANSLFGTRVHMLKEDPQEANVSVEYSDYYRESFLVRRGIKLDIVIPDDAKAIYILHTYDGHINAPDSMWLSTINAFDCEDTNAFKMPAVQDSNIISHSFMHWNLGHFSKGEYPYSTITADNYVVKLNGYRHFIHTYCPNCHMLFNEYDETFAIIDDRPLRSDSLFISDSKDSQVFFRSTSSGYNQLAAFWKEGLLGYKYDVFESLRGVKNRNGTLEYGAGYCISSYLLGCDTLYVMSLHAPNRIKRNEMDLLFQEIVSICSVYDNCILVGDFNRTTSTDFLVLTKADFSILNDGRITHPRTGFILDWVLYRCKSAVLSDFTVYPEAVDENGELLSDHLPISFKVAVSN